MSVPPKQPVNESSLVKRYALSIMLKSALDHDIEVIDKSELKQSKVYCAVLQSVQSRLIRDIAKLLRHMRSRGIKVSEINKKTQCVKVNYFCRGYKHQMNILWKIFNPALERLLGRYIQANKENGEEADGKET